MRGVIYRFAGFSVDSDTRQLLTSGGEVHLSPKAFELLLMLIEHRARAMSKAELQERLWPSTFVGETNLATLVAEIRRALDDSAHDSAYVRTVHRFGYRFVAVVAEQGALSHQGLSMYLASGDQRYPLREGASVIGRARDAAIRIDAGGVSRYHARIIVRGDKAQVEDLGSKNGTFVDGQPVNSSCVLKDGDELRVGPVAFTFRVTTPTLETETIGS
jgi:DNA-binding winged helix-turn-helix (wHTH) protein